uniref:C2H2-type domain-containing protein n=1 Tax=Callorhinchus milii TaxID=7868 RepID=A0A4W3HK44_CALMI
MESIASFDAESRGLGPLGMFDLEQGCVPGASGVRGREKVVGGKQRQKEGGNVIEKVEESIQRQTEVGGGQGGAEDTQAAGLEPGEAGLTVAVTETVFTRVQEHSEVLPQGQGSETEAESQSVPKARSRIPVFWCPRCGADFNSLLGLVKHQRRHRNEPGVCRKRVPPPLPRGQRSHSVQDATPPQSSMPLTSRPSDRQRRPTKREHRCLECGRRFTQASSLLRHRRVHTGERPFTCQVCGKGFIQASDLVKHSRVHSGERAFWCPQCGKRFRQPETLAKHRKLVHRSEGTATSSQPPASGPAPGRYAQVVVECSDAPAPRRFPCLVCGRELNSSSSLLRHQRVCPSGQRLHLGL